MRLFNLIVALLALALLSSCRPSPSESILDDPATPVANIRNLNVPSYFTYQTTETRWLSAQVKTLNPHLINAGYQIHLPDGTVVSTGQLNNGQLNTSLPIGTHLSNLTLSFNNLGLPLMVANASGNFEPVQQNTPATHGRMQVINTPYTYLGQYDAQGVPNYLTPNANIAPNVYDNITESLPEGKPVPDYNPEYIAQGAATEILVTQPAQVWVTFLHEGAGWRNILGYYTYPTNNPPATVNQINKLNVVFPNVSFAGSGGGLQSGNRVYLGSFAPNTTIAWFLVANGWQGDVTTGTHTNYSNPAFNAGGMSQMVTLADPERELLILGFEDWNRTQGGDNDFNDAVFSVEATPYTAIETSSFVEVKKPIDTDGDGINDGYDDFPNNAQLAYATWLPAKDAFGSLAFEDLWPSMGDYDLNDVVIDYNFTLKKDPSNRVRAITLMLDLVASGAGYHNGFGIELPMPANAVASVTGSQLNNNLITLNPNGCEQGQDKAVIIAFDDFFDLMPRPGANFVNTQTDASPLNKLRLNIEITLAGQGLSENTLTAAPYNPFIIVNADRSREVHLPGYPPTKLCNPNLLGTNTDGYQPGQPSTYYKSNTGLPYAIHLPVPFDYPAEKISIIDAHTQFSTWVQSGGSQATDWYLNKNGYRNIDKIYNR